MAPQGLARLQRDPITAECSHRMGRCVWQATACLYRCGAKRWDEMRSSELMCRPNNFRKRFKAWPNRFILSPCWDETLHSVISTALANREWGLDRIWYSHQTVKCSFDWRCASGCNTDRILDGKLLHWWPRDQANQTKDVAVRLDIFQSNACR